MLPCSHPADGRGGTSPPVLAPGRGTLCAPLLGQAGPCPPSPWPCPGPSQPASPVGCSESAGVCAPSCPWGAPSLSGVSGVQASPCQCCHPGDYCSGLCRHCAPSVNTGCTGANVGAKVCLPALLFHRLSQTLRTKCVHTHVRVHVCAHVCTCVCLHSCSTPAWPHLLSTQP